MFHGDIECTIDRLVVLVQLLFDSQYARHHIVPQIADFVNPMRIHGLDLQCLRRLDRLKLNRAV